MSSAKVNIIRSFSITFIAAIFSAPVVCVAGQDCLPLRCRCSLSLDLLDISCNGEKRELDSSNPHEATYQHNTTDSNSCQYLLGGLASLSASDSSSDDHFNRSCQPIVSAIHSPLIFENVNHLTTVILEHSRLQSIPELLFRPLKYLQVLDLSNNLIKTIEENQFASNVELKELGLAHNQLTVVPANVFKNNVNLECVSLVGNRNLSTLPASLFQNAKSLELLDLGDCNFTLSSFSGVFHYSEGLRVLYLDRNQLYNLDADIFSRLKHLSLLDLSRNRFEEVDTNWFGSLSQLETLNLSHNSIKHIAPNAFSGLSNLKSLDLQDNLLTQLGQKTFNLLPLLEVLNLNDNQLSNISSPTMKPLKNLKTIRLARNNLTFSEGPESLDFGRQSPLFNNRYLDWIDLSGNQIGEIFYDWHFFNSVSHLNLSDNRIVSLNYNDLNLTPKEQLVIDLRRNLIQSIDFSNSFKVPSNHSDSDVVNRTLLIDDNPLHCDCVVYYLAQYMNESTPIWNIRAPNLKCQTPASLFNVTPTAVDPNLLLCDCSVKKSPCLCRRRPADSKLLVDCEKLQLVSIPTLVTEPDYQVHANLASNRINLTQLKPSKTFAYVHTLDLSHNFIDDEMISTANWSRIFQTHFPNLEHVNLSHNDMTFVPSSVIDTWNRTRAFTMALSGNPWQCDCQIVPLLDYIISTSHRIVDIDDIHCQDGLLLSTLNRQYLCQTARFALVVALSATIACFIVLLAVIYRYRYHLIVWMYGRNVYLPVCVAWDEEEVDADRPYDAFVSYSHHDEHFINRHLIPNLEHPGKGLPSYRLCLHGRDWLPGQWIPDQICQSVANSKRTLIILSKHFVESTWGRQEFREAYQQALVDKKMRLIVILLEDMPPKEKMDSQLSQFLALNTYLKWGDRWFWDRLRYALPHKNNKSTLSKSSVFPKTGSDLTQ